MIAITFALPQESSALIKRLRDPQRHDISVSGKLDKQPVTVFHTGVGAKNCGPKIEKLLHRLRPKIVVSSGFAGAIRDDLKVGDLILAENFSDHHLLVRAETVLREHKPRSVKLFSCPTIVDTLAERDEIARTNEAAAVDMETETLATLCNAHGVPLLSIRAISDTPSRPFPAPPSILFDVERQQTNVAGLIRYSIIHPTSIWRLLRFNSQVGRARATLTAAIVILVRSL